MNNRETETFQPVDFLPIIGLVPHFKRAITHAPLKDDKSYFSRFCLTGYYLYQISALGYASIKGLEALQ